MPRWLSRWTANDNLSDKDGVTPLMWAVAALDVLAESHPGAPACLRRMLVRWVEILLPASDIERRNKEGRTAWDIARDSERLGAGALSADIIRAHAADRERADIAGSVDPTEAPGSTPAKRRSKSL